MVVSIVKRLSMIPYPVYVNRFRFLLYGKVQLIEQNAPQDVHRGEREIDVLD